MRKLLVIVTIVAAFTFNVDAAQIVVLGPDNKELGYREFEAKESDTAFTALKKIGLSYVDEGDKYPQYKGVYITSIAGYGMSKTNGWVYTVNKQSPNVSASEYKIDDDSQIIWCAYNNVNNIDNYVFPPAEKKYKKDTTISEDVIVDDILDSIQVETEQQDFSPETVLEEKKENNVKNEEWKNYYDIRSLGYVGLVVTFIIGISFIRQLIRKDYDEESIDKN